jgi:hypothetical protein
MAQNNENSLYKQILIQKCFTNKLEPFEGVLVTVGLELWLQKKHMLRTFLKENGV